jgi:prepilin-type N-terminal cleavage/methylation domain-containing protein
MKKPAFTLIEVLMAVTVFTLFIGFAIGAYLNLHQALHKAEERRHLLLESEVILHRLSAAIKVDAVDYNAYAEDMGALLGGPIEGSVLHLKEGGTYSWDELESTLLWTDGTAEEILTKDPVKLTLLKFRIFPGMNPYEAASSADYYQPTVQINLQLSLNEEVLDFQTSATSRIYR